jgi:hypothetical protein
MCRSIKGTAGLKRTCIIEEHTCEEKKIVGFVSGTMQSKSPVRVADPVIPESVLPSSSDSDETQVAFSSCSTFIHTDLGIHRHHHLHSSGTAANPSCPSRAKYLQVSPSPRRVRLRAR